MFGWHGIFFSIFSFAAGEELGSIAKRVQMQPRPLQSWYQAKQPECGHLLQNDINWAASMVSNGKGACLPKQILVMGIKMS